MITLFIGVSLYAVRLWWSLRSARQLINKLVIVSATPIQSEAQAAEGGCAGFLIVFLMLALALTIVALNS